MPHSNHQDKPLSAQAANSEAGTRTGDGNKEQPRHRTSWNTLTARVISLVSRKGGVGKTTSAVNLGAALALSGQSVLLVSVDPQCGVSKTLGYGQKELQGGLGDIFTSSASVSQLVHTTRLKNLFFISPNVWSLPEEEEFHELMATCPDVFVQAIDRGRDLYDTILIDCPPAFNAATRAALLASDGFLVPVQAEELCRDSLGRLLDFVRAFREDSFADTNLAMQGEMPALFRLEGLFLTMVNARTRMSKHVETKVRQEYATDLLETVVPRATRVSEMALRGKPVAIYDRKSAGSRAYFNLADELLQRFARQHLVDGSDEPLAVSGETALKKAGVEADAVASGADRESREDEAVSLAKLFANSRQNLPEQVFDDGDEDKDEDPELVSLDDLLAEEESRAGDEPDWEKPLWGRKNDTRERFN